jgi:colanic acid biosynthesis glycosyl transferase WcaI
MSGARSWLHIQDFEIDAAFQLGMLRGKLVRGIATSLERILLRRFDRVSSISPRMVERLQEKGVASERGLLFPNWVDTYAISPMPSNTEYRRELGIPDTAFVAMYSGTMGAKQGLELLAEMAVHLKSETEIHFVFCGNGPGREALHLSCADLPRVHWLPLQPVERLSELLSTADVHLLPQQQAAADLMLPSKLTGMLASGRPVLTTADHGTELERWVKDCGAVVPPGDSATMAITLLALFRDPQRRHAMGEEGRRRALTRLPRDTTLERFCVEMENALVTDR